MTDDLISRAAALDTLTELSCNDNAHWGVIIEAIRALPAVAASQPSEEVFMQAVWDALKADTSDLGKQRRILTAFRAVAASQTPYPAVKADSQQSVRVKPLVWEGDTIVCTTALILREGGVCLDRDKADQFERERADEILSLLETQPDPRDEVIAGLMEALAFYADKSTYETQYERMPCDCCTDIFEPINDDKGSKARAAIAAAKQLIVRC